MPDLKDHDEGTPNEPARRTSTGLLALALIGILAIVAFAVHPRIYYLPPRKVDVLLLVCAVLCLLPAFRPVLQRTLQGPALLLALCMVAFSLSASLAEGHGWPRLRQTLLLVAFVLLTLASREVFWEHGARILGALVLVGGVLGALALGQIAGFDTIYASAGRDSPFLAVATFANTNAFAAVAAPLFAVACARSLCAPAGRVLPLLAAALLAAGLTGARSRGGWLAAAVGLLAVFWLLRHERSRTALLSLAVAVLVGTGAALLLQHPESEAQQKPLGLGLERHSNVVRWSMARGSLALIQEAPWFGQGPGQFRVEYPRHREQQEAAVPTRYGTTSEVDHPHSMPLRIAVEGGLVTAALLGAFLLAVLWHLRGMDAAWQGDDGSGRAALLAGMLAFCTSSLTWSTLQHAEVLVIAALLAGGALASRVEWETVRGGGLRLGTRLVAVGLTVAFLGVSLPGLVGATQTLRATAGETLRESELLALGRAAGNDPFDLDRQKLVGGIYHQALVLYPEREDLLVAGMEKCSQRALAVHPQHVDSLERLAEAAVRRGQPERARRFLERIWKLEPWRGGVEEELAALQQRLGRGAEAARLRADQVRRVEELGPVLEQAEVWRRDGHARQAAQLLDALRARFGGQAELHRQYALVLKDLGDSAGRDREMHRAQLAYALESLRLGETEVARSSNLRLARRFGPDETLSLALLEACIDVTEGRREQAAKKLSASFSQPPTRVPVWLLEGCRELWQEPALAPLLEALALPEPGSEPGG